MKTTHSIEHELLNNIVTLASIEILKCDLGFDIESEEIISMAQALVIIPEALLSKDKERCLLKVAEYLNDSGLINGYSPTLDDIKGILFHSHMLQIILNNINEIQHKSALNFYNDLADSAGHHVHMYAEDSLNMDYVEYFNEKLPDFFEYQVSTTELRLLYYYHNFASALIDWKEEEIYQPHLKLVT